LLSGKYEPGNIVTIDVGTVEDESGAEEEDIVLRGEENPSGVQEEPEMAPAP
jgi:hypothetical protein